MLQKTLLITNDFPPQYGGIQSFLYQLALYQPPESLVVYAPNWPGAQEFDSRQPFEIIRDYRSRLPLTASTVRQAVALVRAHACRSVWFGEMFPLGLMAPALRRAGAQRVVAQTHGAEVSWTAIPGSRMLVRRIARALDAATFISQYTGVVLNRAFGGLTRLVYLPPGVDSETFRPGVDGEAVRAKYGLNGRPVIVCISRLVRRKGQDTLIKALPEIGRRVPGAALLIAGVGSYEPELRRDAERSDTKGSIVFTGAVPWSDLPAHYAAGDVFAMPCRSLLGGLEVEGLGMVYLEASACGLPVVGGSSGGAPEAIRDGQTGYVVDGRDTATIASRISDLLLHRESARQMGAVGRAWVEEQWRWKPLGERMRMLLNPDYPLNSRSEASHFASSQ